MNMWWWNTSWVQYSQQIRIWNLVLFHLDWLRFTCFYCLGATLVESNTSMNSWHWPLQWIDYLLCLQNLTWLWISTSAEEWIEGAVMLVDKPKGWTSFDVCGKLRGCLKKIGIKKVCSWFWSANPDNFLHVRHFEHIFGDVRLFNSSTHMLYLTVDIAYLVSRSMENEHMGKFGLIRRIYSLRIHELSVKSESLLDWRFAMY